MWKNSNHIWHQIEPKVPSLGEGVTKDQGDVATVHKVHGNPNKHEQLYKNDWLNLIHLYNGFQVFLFVPSGVRT